MGIRHKLHSKHTHPESTAHSPWSWSRWGDAWDIWLRFPLCLLLSSPFIVCDVISFSAHSQCRKSVDGLHWLGRCKVDTLTKSTKGGREVHKPALIQQLWKMTKDLLGLRRKNNEILFPKIRTDPDQNQKQGKSGVLEFYCDVITYHIWQSYERLLRKMVQYIFKWLNMYP